MLYVKQLFCLFWWSQSCFTVNLHPSCSGLKFPLHVKVELFLFASSLSVLCHLHPVCFYMESIILHCLPVHPLMPADDNIGSCLLKVFILIISKFLLNNMVHNLFLQKSVWTNCWFEKYATGLAEKRSKDACVLCRKVVSRCSSSEEVFNFSKYKLLR